MKTQSKQNPKNTAVVRRQGLETNALKRKHRYVDPMRVPIAHPFDARLSWRWPITDVMRWTGRGLTTMKRWRADPTSIDPGLLKLCQFFAYGVVPLEHPAAVKLWRGFHFDPRDGALVMPNNTVMTAQQLLAARTHWSIAETRTLRFERMERELIALRAEVLRLRDVVAYA